MAGEGSTARRGQPSGLLAQRFEERGAASMIRVFLIVVALGVLVLAGGVVYLGLFPPNPPQHAVEKTLPLDKVQPQTH